MGLYDSLIPGNKAAAAPSKPASYGIYGGLVPSGNAPVTGAMDFPVPSSSTIANNPAVAPVQNNSTGMNIVRGIGSTLSDAISSWFSGAQALPHQLVQDVQSSLPDFKAAETAITNHASGVSFSDGLAHVVTGLAKAAGRPALDVAGYLFSPISSALGAAISDSGLQSLQDHTGQVIADTSGITNMPAFQNFAMQHPNAGADFNRVLNGLLGGMSGEDISPKTITTDLKSLVTNLVKDGKPAEAPIVPESRPTSLESPHTPIGEPSVTTEPSAPSAPATEPQAAVETAPRPAMEPASPLIQTQASEPTGFTTSTAAPEALGQVSTPESRGQAINKPVETGNERVASRSVSIDNMQEHLSPDEFQAFKQDTSHAKVQRIEQVQKAQAFVHENPAVVDRILYEGAHPPEGIRTQDIFTEARIKALDDYRAGKIPLEQYMKTVKADELLGSRTGSEFSARANRFDKNDPAAWLAKARETLQRSSIKYEDRATRSSKAVKSPFQIEAKKAGDTISKARVKLVDYQKVLDAITC